MDLAPALLDLSCELLAEVAVIDDAGFGDVQAGYALDVGFVAGDLFGAEGSDLLEAVGCGPILQRSESGEFAWVCGDDDFAADFVRNVVLLAKCEKLAVAVAAIEGFERAWLVVNARVDDAAVASGLVVGELGFLFEEDKLEFGTLEEAFVGSGESDYSAADDN